VKKLVKEMKKMPKKEQKGVSFPIRQVPMSSRVFGHSTSTENITLLRFNISLLAEVFID
jgi:hypothetical protein